MSYESRLACLSVMASLSLLGGCATPIAADSADVAWEMPPDLEFGVSGGKDDLENQYRTVVLISSERGGVQRCSDRSTSGGDSGALRLPADDSYSHRRPDRQLELRGERHCGDPHL